MEILKALIVLSCVLSPFGLAVVALIGWNMGRAHEQHEQIIRECMSGEQVGHEN